MCLNRPDGPPGVSLVATSLGFCTDRLALDPLIEGDWATASEAGHERIWNAIQDVRCRLALHRTSHILLNWVVCRCRAMRCAVDVIQQSDRRFMTIGTSEASYQELTAAICELEDLVQRRLSAKEATMKWERDAHRRARLRKVARGTSCFSSVICAEGVVKSFLWLRTRNRRDQPTTSTCR
mmetsp:Transcript_44432/g.117932  ORF Transcript_44432/g.117932 Transcript_44432/m.117932 type:complete len:181 (-) Transcript_44432:389-931(-)